MTDQPTVTIDGTEYALDQLSDQAKARLGNLRFIDQEIGRLQAQIAVFQTARMTYATALKTELETTGAAG